MLSQVEPKYNVCTKIKVFDGVLWRINRMQEQFHVFLTNDVSSDYNVIFRSQG